MACWRTLCLPNKFLVAAALYMLSTSSTSTAEYVVLHAPSHVRFVQGAGAVRTSELPAIIASFLGLPLGTDVSWRGLREGSLFERPKASVLVTATSLSQNSLKLPSLVTYATVEDTSEVESESVVNYIESLDWPQPPLMLDFNADLSVSDVKSRYPGVFDHVPGSADRLQIEVANDPQWSIHLGSLNLTRDEDLYFVTELYVVAEIAGSLKLHKDSVAGASPDFYHFRVSSLSQLVRRYGVESIEVHDALRLLEFTLEKVATDFKQLYHGNVVIQFVAFSPSASQTLVRRAREASSTSTSNNFTHLNLAPQFTFMYPAIFNIVLWSFIAMSLAVYAIAWGMWNMDPGRDSLIYRMTSQRMKKD